MLELLPSFMACCISACNTLFLWFTISCNQKCSVMLRMHQIRFRFSSGLRPGPLWGRGSSWCSPRLPSRLEWGIPLCHSPPCRRLRRLVLGTYGASRWVRREACSKDSGRDRRPCTRMLHSIAVYCRSTVDFKSSPVSKSTRMSVNLIIINNSAKADIFTR